MTDEGMFSFEDAAVVIHPMVTSPLPGLPGGPRAFTSPASMQPSTGMLFGSSPRPASGVTRGERRKKRELGWFTSVNQQRYVEELSARWKIRNYVRPFPVNVNII
jgi:hypothetical protein